MIKNKRWESIYPDFVQKEISISNRTIPEILEQTVIRFPQSPAVSYKEQVWTYAELKSKVDAFASALQQYGFVKGDRAAIMLPNSPEYLVAYFGILSVGGIVVQINPLYTERELHYMIQDSGAETIIALHSLSAVIKAVQAKTTLRNTIWVQPSSTTADNSFDTFLQSGTGRINPVAIDSAEDLAVLQYTGGTTGRSKGVILTHRNIVANIEQEYEANKSFLIPGKEKIMTVIPLFHVYGMTLIMISGVMQGSCLILIPRFDPEEVLNTIKREKPTRFPGVPTMFMALNTHPKFMESGWESIKFYQSGSAPMPVEFLHEFEGKTGGKIIEGYGLTEASPAVTIQSFVERKFGSVGVPLPNTNCKIVDMETGIKEISPGEIGELIIQGPQIMKGYWNMPEETAEALRDGWLYTGDIAQMDEDGYIFIVDRKKDLILASGFNVYPREVEEVLYEHPSVEEAVVIGVVDSYRGETVKAIIVLKDDMQTTEDDLKAHCKKNLTLYKVPKIFEFRSELPKTNVGKILRTLLRDQ